MSVKLGSYSVVQALEDDAVAKFDASWDQLGERLAWTLRRQSASR